MQVRPRLASLIQRHRSALSAFANIVVFALAYWAAFLLRFDLKLPERFQLLMMVTLPASIAVHYAAFFAFKLTHGWWRYVGIGDFLNAVKAATVGAMCLAAYVLLFHRGSFYPRSVFLLNSILIVGLSIGIRLVVRLWRQLPNERQTQDKRKRLLIVGAGDTGEALLREIRQSGRLNYQVVAFLDHDKAKQGAYINGVAVADTPNALPDIASRLRIDEIIVAIPSASGQEMRKITERCRETDVPFRVMPATWEVLSGAAGLSAAREVDILDLLRRPPIELDLVEIGRFLSGKRVLVTGAAGSIGSEIALQVLRYGPSSLVCLDHDENALFYLERTLRTTSSAQVVRYTLADVTDETRMGAIFARESPEVVFHAAAHKHVPLLESNLVEGVRNNVFGTQTTARLAGQVDAETFVLISTDKAVNPASVMGATKRIAELLVQQMPYATRYAAVRFGNVLGSQGSVVPILKQQIAAGGPVTVTHPEMRRYFMTIPEAVELVIQAAAMGRGHEIFMLEMGDPIKILDLARDLIGLSGLRPEQDIEIVFTGIRPGEKLTEELYLESEEADRTTHPKILVARRQPVDRAFHDNAIEELHRAVEGSDEAAIKKAITTLVPEYKRPNQTPSNVVPIRSAQRPS